ncbi:TonB-dependent receptor [Pseudomaricurvus alkylphenolicus]|uniref:TonB-dependent receptor n=1 Tax=Pseudomaricurvus alkylphenolicus TaxID=1306991 RepID=UPI0014230B2F|nr:TonB-dependent receptor [Pseudomaricurvus alkylphenolicus]NIB38342.1 TonB-dependent receptor [Pseudomaricurvus alkylphenolicus]
MPKYAPLASTIAAIIATSAPYSLAGTEANIFALEEIVVVAQKREESLQDAPLSVSALGAEQLETLGISDLSDLTSGAIPSLKVQPFFNGNSTLVLAMRGIGTSDAEQITKDLGVGVYVDGVYLGRSTGLSLGLADLAQIEVLKGPQGSLYGRNSLGGAVNMISQKPSGELNFKQQLNFGNYDHFKSVTHIDLPEAMGVSTKLSYVTSRRDGLVENSYPGAQDFSENDSEGWRLALNWSLSDELEVDYSYEKSKLTTTSNYFTFTHILELAPGFQLFDNSLLDDGRQDQARFPLPLEASTVETSGHSLVATWDASSNVTLKSITAYRDMEEDLYAQFGGVLATGFNTQSQTNQDQISQEFQIIGSAERLEYIAGLYWYKETADYTAVQYGTLAFSPTLPDGTPFFGVPVFSAPELFVTNAGNRADVETKSWAAFGQVSWTPPILNDQLELILGLRYTDDSKSALRSQFLGQPTDQTFDFETTRVDPTATISYHFESDVTVYMRYATGYRSGGANSRSEDFAVYDEEEVVSWELGAKAEFMNGRVRVNAAYWDTTYSDKQVDFPNPANPAATATINASNGNVELSGLELDISAMLTENLRMDLTYEYMGGSIKEQLNPFTNGFDKFEIQSLPRHNGTLSLDYSFKPFSFGRLSANLNYISSAAYFQNPANFVHHNSKDLINARLTLSDVSLGANRGDLKVALWGKNLTDKEYLATGLQTGFSGAAVWGDPRTYGVDIAYEF